MRQKVIVFYIKAGGGHQSTANSIIKQISLAYPDSHTKCVDIAHNNPLWQQKLIIDIYNWLIEDGKYLWLLLNVITKSPLGAQLFLWLPKFFAENSRFSQTLEEEIIDFRPDLIVSCYYFVAGSAKKICDRHRIQSEIVTVVSDIFSAHPIWFTSKDTKYLVFSKAIFDQAINYINKDLVTQFGYFFNSRFEAPLSNNKICEIKAELELDISLKTVLILSGGNGLLNADRVLVELINTNLTNFQIIFVAGRNQELYNKCQAIINNQRSSKIKLFGFCDNVYELMNIADVIIGKAGPATVLEAVALHKPLFLSHYIWEQEKGNVDWVVNNNYGIYEPQPKKLAELVTNYFDSAKSPNVFKQTNLKSSSTAAIEHLIEG